MDNWEMEREGAKEENRERRGGRERERERERERGGEERETETGGDKEISSLSPSHYIYTHGAGLDN